jgi:hypothetical protein
VMSLAPGCAPSPRCPGNVQRVDTCAAPRRRRSPASWHDLSVPCVPPRARPESRDTTTRRRAAPQRRATRQRPIPLPVHWGMAFPMIHPSSHSHTIRQDRGVHERQDRKSTGVDPRSRSEQRWSDVRHTVPFVCISAFCSAYLIDGSLSTVAAAS